VLTYDTGCLGASNEEEGGQGVVQTLRLVKGRLFPPVGYLCCGDVGPKKEEMLKDYFPREAQRERK